jgi:ferredoxin-NADP reductase
MPTLTSPRRLLASPVLDLLLGPHGVDRYLELVKPALTVHEARATVLDVRHQTERSVTLTLRPNAAWAGFEAGQFVPVGVEIDGVRHTRTFSPASPATQRHELELTVTVRAQGLVSQHLKTAIRPGDTLYLGRPAGEFVLPQPRPRRLTLISGGSGITPVLSMLRTLLGEGHGGEIDFLHYARTRADWLYRDELIALAARHPNLRVRYLATREGDGHLCRGDLGEPGQTAVCGPPALIEAVRALSPIALAETFAPPTLNKTGAGTVHFTRSARTADIGTGSLLERAEAAGLQPKFGCRMGICHTCTCRKTAGAVQNLLTGEISDAPDEDIQLCISVPAGDVVLEI